MIKKLIKDIIKGERGFNYHLPLRGLLLPEGGESG